MQCRNMGFPMTDMPLDVELALGTMTDRDFLIMRRDMKVKK